MSTELSNRISFLDFLIGRKKAIHIYQTVVNTLTNEVLQHHSNQNGYMGLKKVFSLFDTPSYIKGKLFDAENTPKQLEIPLVKGYLIDLRPYKSVEYYLGEKFGKKSRSKLRRYRKRLDLCISPKYMMYHGHIEKTEYESLFTHMENMMAKRFHEKQENNFELPFLKLYEDVLYDAINSKKGCLFAIYDGDKPIDIGINFIYGSTLFSCNSIYDVDYEVFNLGKIDMYEHLKWCFENDIKIMDLGRGDFFHKRKWVNGEYRYERLLFYKSGSVDQYLVAKTLQGYSLMKYYLISFLKKLGVHLLIGRFIRYRYRMGNASSIKETIKTKLMFVDHDWEKSDSHPIDHRESKYANIRKAINTFLYKGQEKKEKIKVYQSPTQMYMFFVKGERKKALIQLYH